MQQGDYPPPPPPPPPPYYPHLQPPPYHHHPPPPPPQQPPTTFASAPPFSGAADYTPYSPNYPSSFPHIPDPTPPLPPPPPQQPPQQYHTPPYYPPYDPHHQSNPNYPPYDLPQSNPNYPPYDPQLSSPNYPHSNPNPSSTSYVPQFDSGAPKFEHGSGYFDDNLGGYGSYGSNRSNLGGGYDYKDDGVYAYEGKTEPYGARGTMSSSSSSTKSSNWSGLFDDYGRAISFPKDDKEKKSSSGGGTGGYSSSGSSLKVVRAVPKVEDQNDVKGGVQKFRVKLLPESGGQSVMDVLCMVGLDGIRMLDPNTSRTLRIYPLETVTRCDKVDSSTFAFWSKTSVDVEPRRIRLQSNSYTTNTILDTVTAATVQFKEMGGRTRPSEFSKASEPSSEKKKGLGDWIYKLKPVNEEKDHWVPDEAVSKCTGCGSDFSAFNRRHHCRNCGDVFCDKCTQGRTPLTSEENAQPVRVCDRCMAEVTHRLSKAKEAASRPVTLQSHEDLAKKLQEEMEKNLRISSGTKSESSGKRMREVACPTCTVHLQVQVPSSGSETIECGVCQHPFIVSAH